MDTPFFMTASEASEYLWITSGQLQKCAPYAFHLGILGIATRLWPRAYVATFATHTRSKSLKSVTQAAKDFATLPATKALIEEIREKFEKRLASRNVFTGNEVADVFCVTRMTISNWQKKKVLIPADIQLPRRQQGSGRQVECVFLQAELHRISKWHMPKV